MLSEIDRQSEAGPPEGVPATGLLVLHAPNEGKVLAITLFATEEDLRKLPKVGHTKAQAILALRAQMKKFTRVVIRRRGIGSRPIDSSSSVLELQGRSPTPTAKPRPCATDRTRSRTGRC